MKKFLLLTVFLSSLFCASAQELPDVKLKGISGRRALTETLLLVEKEAPLRFFYLQEWLDPFYVDESYNGLSVEEALNRAFRGTEITYFFLYDYAVVFIKDPKQAIERQGLIRKALASKKQVDKQIIGDPKEATRGAHVTLSGAITSASNDSRLVSAVVLLNGKAVGSSDPTGHYKVNIPVGEHVLTYRYENFAEKVIDLSIYKDGVLNVSLEEIATVLEEVVISDQAIVNSRIGQSTLRVNELKRAPTFLGEVDLIKQLQTQAGVTSVGEVASGYNVRGGGVDQNLIVYDGTPIFNTSHAIGFFTAFNPEAIDKVNFYRGGIPAEFGGRISSVLNMTSREGAYDKWRGSAGIGMVSSYLSAGGPIKRDTTSLFISGRTSYSNWMLHSIKSNFKNLSNSSVAFYDGSLKFAHKFNSDTKISFSGYVSHDDFSLANDTVYSWQNIAMSLRFDKRLSDKLSSSVTASVGNYNYLIREEDIGHAADLTYNILYPSLNIDFNHSGAHEFSFGLNNTFYSFAPGKLEPTTEESTINPVEMDNEKSIETALYLSDAFYLRQDLFVEAGLRMSMFNSLGPGTVYSYAPGPLEIRNIVDSTVYKNGDVIKTYGGIEPRVSLRYTLTPNSSVKFAYNRLFQYLHMITNSVAVNPVDIWQPSNSYFKPQIGDQVSLGYYRNVYDNTIEMFVEGYYKHVRNVLDYKDGASLILNDKLETALLRGVARSFGIELSATKIKGRLQGSFNYAFSRSFRQVNGSNDAERINDGAMYPSNFDQPHVVNFNWRYGISRRHFFSGNFTYHTGRPMSLPSSSYQSGGVIVADFSARNEYRIPNYHRMDLAFIIEGSHKRRKIFDGTWVVSLYNVYNRKNVYSVFFQPNKKNELQPYTLSVIGSIIPSVSYSVKF